MINNIFDSAPRYSAAYVHVSRSWTLILQIYRVYKNPLLSYSIPELELLFIRHIHPELQSTIVSNFNFSSCRMLRMGKNQPQGGTFLELDYIAKFKNYVLHMVQMHSFWNNCSLFEVDYHIA